MAVKMYGNINGTFQASKIDLFSLAKEQDSKPKKLSDTKEGADIAPIKIDISAEGMRALLASKFPKWIDINSETEKRKFEFEHQPVISYKDRIFLDMYEKIDAMEMFAKYYNHIPSELKKDILEDGFTKFNHDALSNISYQIKNKNIVFKYSSEQEKLEDDIEGFSFRLPKDSYQMCELGTALHNCVASYAESVQNKKCTIVYAQKDDGYKICIEVRGNEIYQERVDRNAHPNEEENAVLLKWHERHGLHVNY